MNYYRRFCHTIRRNDTVMMLLIVLGLIVIATTIGKLAIPTTMITKSHLLNQFQMPLTEGHIVGTDAAGRDVLAVFVVATNNTLLVTGIVTIVTVSVGTVVGVWLGMHGGRLPDILMRLIDFWNLFPALLLMMLIVFMMGTYSMSILICGLIVINALAVVRFVRGLVAQTAVKPFIQSARYNGVSEWYCAVALILPDILPEIWVMAGFQLTGNLGIEATLSFLGLGLPFQTPSLGTMVNQALQPDVLTMYWWIWALPVVMLAVLGGLFLELSRLLSKSAI